MDKESTNTPGAESNSASTILPVDGAASASTSPTSAQPTSAQPASTPSAPAPTQAAQSSAPTTGVIAETSTITNTTSTTAVAAPAPKKKHTGLIIGIIIAALLLLGGLGFAIWYFAFYQNPENVVFDAMNKFLSAEHIAPHGSISTTFTNGDYEYKYGLSIESTSRRLPAESKLVFSAEIRDEDDELVTDDIIKVEVGTIQMSDGVAYLRVDNLTETVDQVLSAIYDEFETSSTYDTQTNCIGSQGMNCAPEQTDCIGAYDTDCVVVTPQPDPTTNLLYDLAELLDEQWWRISISEILDELVSQNTELESWEANAVRELYTGVYTCAINAVNSEYGSELAALYRQNSFVKVEKVVQPEVRPSGTSAYSASLDYYALSNFITETKSIDSATAFYDCYNSVLDDVNDRYVRIHSDYLDQEAFEDMKLSPDKLDDFSAADLKKIFPEDTELILYIDDWGHALRQVDMTFDADDQPIIVSLAFEYEAIDVAAPTEYRPITELFEEIIDLISEYSNSGYDPDDDKVYMDFSCDEDNPGFCLEDLDYSAFDFYGV